MARAIWKGEVIAESKEFEQVEGHVYFPRDAVKESFLRPNDHHTEDMMKGEASFFDLVVDGEIQENAAWCYDDPEPSAENIRGHVAFADGIEIVP